MSTEGGSLHIDGPVPSGNGHIIITGIHHWSEIITAEQLRRTLSGLILGQKGGANRIQILDLIRERPYNLNQLAEALNLNYRTVKHHVNILVENDILMTSRSTGYGDVYFLTPHMEKNVDIYDEIVGKLNDFTTSPKFFKGVLEKTASAVMIIDKEGRTYFWNDGAERMFGYAEEEVLGKGLPIFPGGENFSRSLMMISHGKRVQDLEARAVNKSGSLLDVSITMDVIEDGDGGPQGYTLITRDVTDRKREMEWAARRNDLNRVMAKVNKTALRTSDFGIIALEARRGIMGAGGYLGVSVVVDGGGDRGRPVWKLAGVPEDGSDPSPGGAAPADRGSLASTMSGLIGTEEGILSFRHEQDRPCGLCGGDGAHWTLALAMHRKGRRWGSIILCHELEHTHVEREITMLKELTRDLAMARNAIVDDLRIERLMREYSDLFEKNNDAVLIIDPGTDRCVKCNGRAAEIAHSSKGDMESVEAEKLFRGWERIDGDTRLRLLTGETLAVEGEMMAGEGSTVPVEANLSMITVNGHDRILATMRDLTERKMTLEALKRSERRFALALRAANMGCWDWDITTGELTWSDRIEPIFGLGEGEFEGTYEAFLELVHPDDRKMVEEAVGACLESREDYDVMHRIMLPDESVRWLRETGDVIRNNGGEAVRMLGVVQDVTDREGGSKAVGLGGPMDDPMGKGPAPV